MKQNLWYTISCLCFLKLICLLSNALLQRLFPLLYTLHTPPARPTSAQKKHVLRARVSKRHLHIYKAAHQGLKFDNLRAAAMHINCFALHPRSNGNERWHVLGEDRRQRTPNYTNTHAAVSQQGRVRSSNYLTIVHSGGSYKQSHSPGSKLGAQKSVFICARGAENKIEWRIRCAHSSEVFCFWTNPGGSNEICSNLGDAL